MSTTGRFAAVTNYTDFGREEAVPPASRGDLARCFLEQEAAAADYVAAVDGERYQGFNFIAFDGVDLVYACNRTGDVRVLEPGVYGVTNTHLDDVWPKSERGIAALKRIAATADVDDVVAVLRDESENYLPDGREAEGARRATPAFLRGTAYGTRASTAVIVGTRRIAFAEQQYGPMGDLGARVAETIPILGLEPGRSDAMEAVIPDGRKAGP